MENKKALEQEQILRMSGVNPLKCMRCGKCSATCPSYDEMEYHPHQFVYMVETGEIEELKNSYPRIARSEICPPTSLNFFIRSSTVRFFFSSPETS